MSENLELLRRSVRATQLAVVPPGRSQALPSEGPTGQSEKNLNEADLATAYEQSVAKAVQSIGQTTAIVIQDAADMLRNVSTIETTAIGAATAKWIANPTDLSYVEIINQSITVMQQAAGLYLTIGQNAYTVLSQFQTSATPSKSPAATPGPAG